MPLYTCPFCHGLSLSWDSRSKAFLCINPSCNEAIRPAEEDGDAAQSMAFKISTGRVMVTQEWLNLQAKKSSPSVCLGS